jgi:NADH-quinone oxidoreductase subunit J
MDQPGVVIAFWALSALSVGAALGLVLVRNLLHAVMLLILVFFGVAGLFVTLSADFVAVAQVLIYAGAVSILILFAIFLTPQAERNNAETRWRLPGLAVAVLFAVALGAVIFQTEWSAADGGGFDQTAALIGDALLDRWTVAFEVAAVLLLVATIGAIVLARDED